MIPRIRILASVALVMVGVLADHSLAKNKNSGPGKTRFIADVSEWDSNTPAGPTVIPIGGSGQVNGNFVTVERNGVQIGIRASRRFFQNVDPLANFNQKKVGVYFAEPNELPGEAVWNYDIHVDLRGAFGVAKGKTLDDYDLFLNTDIAPSLFGFPVPLDLGSFLPTNIVLFQTSQNPVFGNIVFDETVEGVYNFSLILTPKTFNGPPLVANMSVIVSDL